MIEEEFAHDLHGVLLHDIGKMGVSRGRCLRCANQRPLLPGSMELRRCLKLIGEESGRHFDPEVVEVFLEDR